MTKQTVSQSTTRPQPVTLEWDDVMSGNFPESSHRKHWHAAVIKAAEDIFASSPVNVNHERLQKAIDIVLARGVTLHEDGTATVKNGSHTYEITDDCSCADSQNRTRYCKHYLAVSITRNAYTQLYAGSGQTNGHQPDEQPEPQPEPPQAQAWECAQAPSSCTLKWAINGIELLLTLRAGTDQELFNRIGRVLPRIEEKLEAQRRQREQARQERQAEQPTPPQGKDGSPSNTSTSQPADEQGWCDYHNEPMWKHTKNGDVWYSHRTDDGKWCRGK